ncbi:hypothetical protein GCK32_000297 [Trichostrongylus colubriformis]|uniref:Phlebovirus glycoprotein G2 fusion domain-containing protein n=1 Tax=Trichostrongylus colubriformis TaxID=6319 RepID=A0AAN8FQW3_TRICO
MPPTPTLASNFTSDGTHLTLRNADRKLNLICDSKEAAASFNCTVNSDCVCQQAENKVNCACTDEPITNVFNNGVQNRFPVCRPWTTFKPSKRDAMTATAHVSAFTKAEFFIQKGRFNKVVTDVTNSICRENNAEAKGCYKCP